MANNEINPNKDYIILTPVAPHKSYSVERFLKNIILFKPPPKEMVFCAEPENLSGIYKNEEMLKEKGIKLVVFTLSPEVLLKTKPASLERISFSREHLRNYFISSPFEWALWLDSDIIPEPSVARILMRIAKKEKVLAVTNQYPSSGPEEKVWSGIACTLTHKAACTLFRFELGYLIWDGKERQLSEDFVFLGLLHIGESAIKEWTGWNSRKIGRFVSVIHEIRPGVDRFLEKDKNKKY